MKKLLTLALAASMILAMSVNAFALGNYVLSTDEVGTEEEEPIADEPELPAEPTGWAEQKVNPDTGAEDFVGVAAAAAAVRPRGGASAPMGGGGAPDPGGPGRRLAVLFLGRGIFLIAAAFGQRMGAKTLCFA